MVKAACTSPRQRLSSMCSLVIVAVSWTFSLENAVIVVWQSYVTASSRRWSCVLWPPPPLQLHLQRPKAWSSNLWNLSERGRRLAVRRALACRFKIFKVRFNGRSRFSRFYGPALSLRDGTVVVFVLPSRVGLLAPEVDESLPHVRRHNPKRQMQLR